MKKKLLLGIALAFAILTLFTLMVNAQDPVETWDISATESDNVTAYIYNDPNSSGYYTMTISGTGATTDWWSYYGVPWYKEPYNGKVKSVVIEEGVTYIGASTFQHCEALRTVSIPSTVTSIGKFAFSYTGINNVSVPSSVTEIGSYAFTFSPLKSIVIPDSVISIGDYAFASCKSMKSAYIPNSVTAVGAYAFDVSNDDLIIFTEHLKRPQGWDSDWNYVQYSGDEYVAVEWGHVHNYTYETSEPYSNHTATCIDCGYTVVEDHIYTAYPNCDGCGYTGFAYAWWDISSTEEDNVKAYLMKYPGESGYSLMFFGNGKMADFTSGGAPWYDYADEIYDINIVTFYEDMVLTHIGSYAFENIINSNVNDWSIPNNIETMGENAFSGFVGNIQCVAFSKPDGWADNWNPDNCNVVWGYGHYHSYAETVTPPTCTNDGYTTYECICGESYTDNVTYATGHAYSVTEEVAPTEYATGMRGYTCASCGDYYTVVLDIIVIPDTNNETVTLKNGTVLPIWDTLGNALIWYKSTANTEDGYASYDFIVAENSKVEYIVNWSGDISGAYANQVGTVKITVDGAEYGLNDIVVFNIKDEDVLVTSDKCKGSVVNCFSGTFKGSTSLEFVYLRVETVAIMANAFYNCSNLQYVNFVDLVQLRRIASQGFSGCSSLFDGKTLDLSNTIMTAIESGTFNNTPPKAIVLPTSVKTLNSWALQGLVKLEEIHIPESITSFGDTMFKNCYSLKTVTGYKSLFERGVINSIQANTFLDCKALESVDFPDSYVSIGNYALKGTTALKGTFKISNECTSIGSAAFQGSGFETVVIGLSVATISDNVFRDSSVKYVYIPENVQTIEREAFRGMKNKVVIYYLGDSVEDLKSITVNNYNGVILDSTTVYVDALSFNPENAGDYNYIVYGYNLCDAYYNGEHEFTVTERKPTCTLDGEIIGICSVCSYSYVQIINAPGHDYEKSVIPPTCVSQGYTSYTCSVCGAGYAENYVDPTGHAFVDHECYCGTKEYIEKWYSLDTTVYLFKDNKNEGCYTITVEGDGYMFDYMYETAPWVHYNITAVTVCDGVTNIGDQAFMNCSSLKTLTVAGSVKLIGWRSFDGCDSLETVVLEEGVESLAPYSFEGCNKLSEINIPDSMMCIYNYAFDGCDLVKELDNGIYYVGNWAVDCETDLTDVVLRDGTVGLGDFNVKFKSIQLPSSLKYISCYAFDGNTNLTEIYIPKGVTYVSFNAFQGCSNITIYCEAESQPAEWDLDWNISGCPVVWGYTEEDVCLNGIFTFKGYSFDGKGGFAVGFAIDYDLLAKYEAMTGKTLEIGVVFAGYANLGGKQPLNEMGEAIALEIGKVVKADITSFGYKYYDFMLTGFVESIMDVSLVIAGYVYDGEDVYYVQANGLSDTVTGITYNEALNS